MKNLDALIERQRNVFGSRLIEAMNYRGVSVKVLANALNKTENTISLWRGRKGNPSFYSVVAIASYLSIDVNFFLNTNILMTDADNSGISDTEKVVEKILATKLFGSRINSPELKELSKIIIKSNDKDIEKILQMSKILVEKG